MLGMTAYAQEYIDTCRSRVDADILAYRNLVASVRSQPAGDGLNVEMERKFRQPAT
jgi:hypothetical protein